MNTIIIPVEDPLALPSALEVLKSGGLVAFPTDTVYGVGALAFDRMAVESIYTAKDRPVEKAIPILIGDVDDLAKVAISIPEIALKLAAHFWPGPLTLVIPKNPELSDIVSAGPTVGVRMPDHLFARSLLRTAGPMAVTSANLSGQPNPTTAGDVFSQLGKRIALIIDGGITPGGVPSTVVDCTSGEPQIIRSGPIPKREILAISESLL
jgi:L-threonylcarbamoyladenylate synthase